MAAMNIKSDVTDQFYRYKMPKLLAKVEGKGNGIKTVVVNMSEIAKALSRPPSYPCKYFGNELGAQTQMDAKTDRYIVNGSHEANKLQELLDGFIRKFVLCPACTNPETDLSVKKNKIWQKCKACGAVTEILESTHKTTTWILKNPPETHDGVVKTAAVTAAGGKKAAKKDTKEKAGTKKNGGKEGEAEGSPPTSAHPHTNGVAPKAGTPPADQLEDEDWGDDASVEAQQERLKQLSLKAQQLAHSSELEMKEADRVNLFATFVKEKKEAGQVGNTRDEVAAVYAEAKRLEVLDNAPLVLCELLFDQNTRDELKQYTPLFKRFSTGNLKAQRALLGGLELLIGTVHGDKLLSKVPLILKDCYDEDLLEEEVILEWGESQKSKYVTPDVLHKLQEKAKPLLIWLKTAQEESDSEGEDVEDDVQFKSDKINKSPTEPMYAHLAQPVKPSDVGTRGAEELEGSDEETRRRALPGSAPAPSIATNKASAVHATTSEEIDIDAI